METSGNAMQLLEDCIRSLPVALDYRDPPTGAHCDRVRGIASELGALCGLTDEEMAILMIAARFHDIGKIGIPDGILAKATPFDAAEWEKMKEHSVIGERIFSAVAIDGSPAVAGAIRHHHEHFDGNGYPDGLAGGGIPIPSRIISIADSYDAMAMPRQYHRPRSHDAIMSILRDETGTKHDPELMDLFCRMIGNSKFRTT